jgi:hypothetical protein
VVDNLTFVEQHVAPLAEKRYMIPQSGRHLAAVALIGFIGRERFFYPFINLAQKVFIHIGRGVSFHHFCAGFQVVNECSAAMAHHQVQFNRKVLSDAEFAFKIVAGDFGQISAH